VWDFTFSDGLKDFPENEIPVVAFAATFLGDTHCDLSRPEAKGGEAVGCMPLRIFKCLVGTSLYNTSVLFSEIGK
jgi:hypothetical protein